MKIGKFGILLITIIVIVYFIWFLFFQDVIIFILENAIDSFGERDIITGLLGVIFLPLLIVIAILGVIGMILYLINKLKG